MLNNTIEQDYQIASTAIHQAKCDENEIIKKHLMLVNRIVNQLRLHINSFCGLEDMRQIGMIGLLEAARRFHDLDDPQFPAFAACRIRGAILDELRRLDWRSRKTRQKAHELNDVTRDLMKALGRQPTDKEIIEALNTDEKDYYARLNANLAQEMQSLDSLLESGIHQFEADSDSIHQQQMAMTLNSALTKLDKRDQFILTLFYQHEMNMHEIALALDVTPARICQLHKHALSQLNQILSA